MNCNVLYETKDMNREEWLRSRTEGIGGSDAGAIAGVNPYKSPLGVYLDKVEPKIEEIDNEYIYWGNRLEDIVAEEFSTRTGLKVQRRNAILQHIKYPFMLANVDRLIVDKENGWGVLEVKTANEYKKNEWENEEVPSHYYLQLQHYLAVTGLGYGYIAVLIGGNKFVYYRVDRNEDIIESLIEIEKDFWENHVLKQEAPAPDGSEDSRDILNKLYPESRDSEVFLPELENVAKDIIKLKEEKKSLEKDIELLEQSIKKEIGENERANIGDFKVSWKSVTTNRLDSKKLKTEHPEIYNKFTKESSYRKFSLK